MKDLDDEVFLALLAYIEAAGRARAQLPVDSVCANLLKFYLLPCGFCHVTCLSPVCMNDCLHARASIAQRGGFLVERWRLVASAEAASLHRSTKGCFLSCMSCFSLVATGDTRKTGHTEICVYKILPLLFLSFFENPEIST